MQTFRVQNFGCRAAQADGAGIEASLERTGLARVEDGAADLVVINTCTVTASADEDVRQAVRRAHRDRPEARILVTGCYAQRAPQDLAAIPGVTWVVGNSHKGQIASLIAEPSYHTQIHSSDIFAQTEFLAAPVEGGAGGRSRPNLKVQDGCDNRCSFCIIPSVRGRSRSANADWVVEEVRRLAPEYPELVLTGINLGRWGRDPGSGLGRPARLTDLLRRLLDETGIARLRLSSVEPMDFTDDLLGLMAESPRIARHVHAPLQSGSDTVLRRMHRKYRPRHYEDRVLKARALMPDAAIGADVMTGFPGETDSEFEETVRFIERLPFTYLHVFTYSEREGTKAAAMSQVAPRVRKERTRHLRELGARKNLDFRQSMVGQGLSVVTHDTPGEAMSGNYLPVALASPRRPRQLVQVRIGSITRNGVAEAGALTVV
ncbi:MAG: tRNA (N(6)-L-threonylcarbamoyladenosine(37)-C(2))-methylthiotransferase MtaB [Acidobacteria bacterium]|nr:tRNA (N(6)-L-threonylcarbamoyladenosine(37)-C(2))-methylthiotransferase MtaB [Acidobacteriota bacterium]